MRQLSNIFHSIYYTLRRVVLAALRKLKEFWQSAWFTKLICVSIALLAGFILSSLGVAHWYTQRAQNQPTIFGVSFIPAYAESLGLDAKETMQALTDDLGIRYFRLVSYWNELEPTRGDYEFERLDWQFAQAEATGSQISLAIGLRQPRWPECHEPSWAATLDDTAWRGALDSFIAAVVSRYKDSPALASYQLENEFLLESFGECRDFSRSRVATELALVKELDPGHPVIMSRSNNLPLLALGLPRADKVGFSIYRRVWNQNIYQGYFNYPLPSWYYAALAGWQKILTGQESIIHELQMEPWPPNGQSITETSREEQDKSMNATMFKDRVSFAEQTGMREIYLWGAEWWYYRKVILGDDSLWRAAQETL